MATKRKGKTKQRTSKAQVVRVIILIFLIILCLSNFNLLGMAGQGIKWLFFGIFGVMNYLLPFYAGFHIIRRMAVRKEKSQIRKKFALGYILMALIDAFTQRVIKEPLVEASMPGDFFLHTARTTEGGGFIGGIIAKALSPTLFAGTIIILLALMTLCVINIVDFSYIYLENGKAPTQAQLKKMREEERRMREEERIERDHARRERELERESRIQVREERKERERARAHDRELKRIEREKEILREQREMEELMAGADRQRRYRETGDDIDYSTLVRASKKVSGVGDFSLGNTPDSAQTGYGRAPVAEAQTPAQTRRRRRRSDDNIDSDIDANVIPETQDNGIDISAISRIYDEEAGVAEPAKKRGSDRINIPDVTEDSGIQDDKIYGGAYDEDIVSDQAPAEHRPSRRRRSSTSASHSESRRESSGGAAADTYKEESKPSSSGAAASAQPAAYEFPPLSLLSRGGAKAGVSQDENRRTAALLLQTLDTFGVKAEITDISCGPAVTRFEIQPPIGTRVNKIVGLSDEIKLNLAAEDIRIEAPIPGKAAIGIEIPNKKRSIVSLYELLESEAFRKSKSLVSFAVGEDVTGNPVVADIAKMPHILIAGQTGAGKSACINSLIMSVLYKARPDQVKMIMIDPKMVELSAYNGIPHLLFPVVTDSRKASGVLNWTVAEMEARYKRFEENGVKNIAGYNEAMAESRDPEALPMPQLLVIIDELADLMMVAKADVETAIVRLTQLARAAGIHLVIVTQRPSVNVITGVIKANVPSKIALTVASGVDSRTILDMNGAEKLLGNGDMLFFPTGIPKPIRVQGAYVTDKEAAAVVSFLRERNELAEDEDEDEGAGQQGEDQSVAGAVSSAPAGTVTDISGAFTVPEDSEKDELFEEAARFVIEKNRGSIGMLQRNFRIGFNRAGRIMDQLADAGIVGPDIGTKPREVLVSIEEFEEMCG